MAKPYPSRRQTYIVMRKNMIDFYEFYEFCDVSCNPFTKVSQTSYLHGNSWERLAFQLEGDGSIAPPSLE